MRTRGESERECMKWPFLHRLVHRPVKLVCWDAFRVRNGYTVGWQGTIWRSIATDPHVARAMRMQVITGRETAYVTRPIYLGQTLAEWDDTRRTWTMETVVERG